MKSGKTILGSIMIFAAIAIFLIMAASSYSLPDVPPVITFVSNTQNADTVAVLTAVAVDSLTNAGISQIEIYQDSALIGKKDCSESMCTFVKTIVENNPATHDYYAITKDLAGNSVQSNIIIISFKEIEQGVDIPPVIANQDSGVMSVSAIGGIGKSLFKWLIRMGEDSFAYKYYDYDHRLEIVRNRTVFLEPNVVDVDDTDLLYEWKLNSQIFSNSKNIQRNFTELGDYNLTLTVSDGKKQTSASWLISVLNETISGTITDIDTGQPLAGINVSFISASSFNPETNDTNAAVNYDSIDGKAIPDAVTDANGRYNAVLPDGTYHIVAIGSNEKDFDVHVSSNKDTKHDMELSEKVITKNFNAEGHIVHSGKYADSNNYTCGNFVYFTMFGVNNGQTTESITFDVQDHTKSGNPNSPIVYYGNLSNPDESLIVPAGQKINKMFKFKIPCSYDSGKYDIHILYNNDTWHKIGNFFVIGDTTAPYVFGWDSLTTYTNKTTDIPCDGENLPQPGTVGYNEIVYYYMLDGYNEPKWGVKVCVDKDILTDGSDNDGITDNDEDGCMVNPPRFVGSEDTPEVSWSKSGYYTMKITAKDDAGNTNSTYTNVTVLAVEEEVDAIATAIYGMFVPGWLPLHKNITLTQTWFSPVGLGFNNAWDRTTIDHSYGDEYLTPWDGFNGPGGVNWTIIGGLEYQITISTPSAKAIFSMTGEEYNYTLSSFLLTLNCVYNNYGPDVSCNYRQFAPEIYTCTPNSISSQYYNILPCYPQAKSINSTTSQVYNIAVRDPNNDPYKIHWYIDENEVLNTEDHNQHYISNSNQTLVFISNSTLAGSHKIKAAAWDASGMNISIINGPHNSYEWTLTVS